jgi:hypothetical protein
MAITYTYPGVGDGIAHPYPTRAEHSLAQPFTLSNVADSNLGPGAYSDNMWYRLDSLREPLLQMHLQERYRTLSLYRNFVPVQLAMRGPEGYVSESMTFKGIFAMEPQTAPVGTRQIWFPSNYIDTWEQSITFKHYADKVAMHRYDDMLQRYLFRGKPGLIPIARILLAESMTIALDILARNAFYEGQRKHYINNRANFGEVISTDLYDLSEAQSIWLDLTYEDIPLAMSPLGNGVGTMVCITTPSVIHDIKQNAGEAFITADLYSRPEMKLKYEVGMYDNVRYIAARRNVLWNVGELIHQAATMADYGPGDGGDANLVDGVYRVGQDVSVGVTKYIEVDDASGFSKNDMVTIHQTRTDAYGVVNGVDYTEGTARLRRITNIDGNRISFNKPLFHEFPLGSYVTLAQSIHPSTFVGGPGGVVNGVADPIEMHPVQPIDDALAIWRFVWLGRFAYQVMRPEVFRLVNSSGTMPRWGVGYSP